MCVGGGGGGGGESGPLETGGGGLPKKGFCPFEPQFGLKRRGAGPPGPSPGSAIARNNDKRLDKMSTNYVKMG